MQPLILKRFGRVQLSQVDEHYGDEIDNYFASHNIEFTKLVFSGNEVHQNQNCFHRGSCGTEVLGNAQITLTTSNRISTSSLQNP